MPLPTARSDEPEADFIARCMADDQARSDFPDDAQRAAVCHRQFRGPEMSCCGHVEFASQPVEQQVLGDFARKTAKIGIEDTALPSDIATRLARTIPAEGATSAGDLSEALADVAGLADAASTRATEFAGEDSLAKSMLAANILGRLRIEQQAARGRQMSAAIIKFKVADVEFLTGPITPDAAFDWISDRVPMTRRQFDALAEHYRDMTFFVSRVNNASAVGKIKAELEKIIAGQDPDDPTLARPLTREKFITRINSALEASGNTPLAPWHAELVYHQATTQAFNAGIWEAIDENVDQIAFVTYRTFDDRRVRGRPGGLYPDAIPSHWALEGFTAEASDPIWDTLAPPLGFNCVPADTVCQGRVQGALKSWYSGKMIEIRTANGRTLRVTPNHPIATDLGKFIRAGSLEKGHNVLSYFALGGAKIRQNKKQHAPATIEDVFKALKLVSPSSRKVRPRPFDLHGDAANVLGEIEIVSAKGELRNVAHWPERVVHENFALSHMGAGFAGFGAGLNHGITGPDWNAFGADSIPNPEVSSEISTLAQGADDRFDRQSAGVHISKLPAFTRGEFLARSLPGGPALSLDQGRVFLDFPPLDCLLLGGASEIDASRYEDTRQTGAGDAAFLGHLVNRSARDVLPDKIIDVREFDFSGHVYDLQCEGGWYAAAGIILTNCRCSVETTFKDDPEAAGKRPTSGEDEQVARAFTPPQGFQGKPSVSRDQREVIPALRQKILEA